jgi:hypothetical protein
MTQEEFDLLAFAIGFLEARLASGQVSPEKFERFLYEEVEESKPLDGQPHMEGIPAVVELLEQHARSMSRILKRAGWREDRMLNLMQTFGRLIATGQVTPTTIAMISGSTAEDFERHVREMKGSMF